MCRERSRRGQDQNNEDQHGGGITMEDTLHTPLPSHIIGSRQESWGCQEAVVSKEEPRTSIWGKWLGLGRPRCQFPAISIWISLRDSATLHFFAQGDPCATDRRRI